MDSPKYRKYLMDFGLVLAVLICLSGTIFIGIVIGESAARSTVETQENQLIASYRETISTKDQLIASLTKSTIQATDAVVTVTTQKEQSEGVVKAVSDKADRAVQSANSAVKLAKENRSKVDAKIDSDTKKLKELQ
jgi:hypothetical protein